jgi:hypothetical protein
LSYKVRNSLALGILLLLILGVGTYIRAYHLPKKARAVEAETKRLDEELQNTPNLVAQFNDLSTALGEERKRWDNRTKDIPPVDVSSQTYAYFSRLIDLSGYVKLDMVYSGTQQKGNYGYNIYNLKGEAPFENLYRFMWYLENGRKLYKIQNCILKGVEVPPKEKEEGKILTAFEMIVHAYFSSVAELASAPVERVLYPNVLTTDPFSPVISSGIPPNMNSLVEIERSDLKAVIPGKAFVLDQNNVIRTLSEGDEVYLGFVTRILPEEGKIECTLNKGGIIDRVELKIRYGTNLQTVVKK